MKLDENSLLSKDGVKSVKQHTRTWYFAKKYMFLRRK